MQDISEFLTGMGVLNQSVLWVHKEVGDVAILLLNDQMVIRLVLLVIGVWKENFFAFTKLADHQILNPEYVHILINLFGYGNGVSKRAHALNSHPEDDQHDADPDDQLKGGKASFAH